MIVRKVVKVFQIAVSSAIALQHESCQYIKGQCLLQLLSSNRVRPVPLLNSDKFRTLQGDEVRQASSVSEDLDHSLSFDHAIEMRFKRMEEENHERIKLLKEKQKRKNDENEKRFKDDDERFERLETENQNLRQRLAAMGNATEQELEDSGVQASENQETSFELVKVDPIKLGAFPLVCYVMACECVTVPVGRSNVNRRATRLHREKHSSRYRWEWWARIAFFSFFLQTAMIVILRYGMAILVRTKDDAVQLPWWQYGIACIIFVYDACSTNLRLMFRGVYCYWKMESLGLFRRHKNPNRTHICAVILAGWEILMYTSIVIYGIVLLQFSQSPVDLILNVVALRFLFEIDDYLIRLAPAVGLLGELDVPKCVVLPTYVTEPHWRDEPIFFWVAKILQYVTLDSPFLPTMFPVLIVALFSNGFKVLVGSMTFLIFSQCSPMSYNNLNFLITENVFSHRVCYGIYKEDPRQVTDMDVFGFNSRHFVRYLLLVFMAIPGVMAFWCCVKSRHANSVAMYAKIACFLAIYFSVLPPASMFLTFFSTKQLELSTWMPELVGIGISWSFFMAVVILIVY